MGLEGYIGKNWKDGWKKHFISFDNDGYYWELYSTFEKVNSVTGQLIDLYDGAHFNGQAQVFLKQCLEEKLNEVVLKNDTWQVTTGWYLENGKKTEVFETVSKAKLTGLLKTFITHIDKAKSNNGNIIFLGD